MIAKSKQTKIARARELLAVHPTITKSEFNAKYPDCVIGKTAFYRLKAQCKTVLRRAAKMQPSGGVASLLAGDFLRTVPAEKLLELFREEILAAIERRMRTDPLGTVLALRRCETGVANSSAATPSEGLVIEYPEAMLTRLAGREPALRRNRPPKRSSSKRAERVSGSELERRIVEYITSNPGCTIADIMRGAGLTAGQYTKARARLGKRIVTSTVAPGRPAHFTIKES